MSILLSTEYHYQSAKNTLLNTNRSTSFILLAGHYTNWYHDDYKVLCGTYPIPTAGITISFPTTDCSS